METVEQLAHSKAALEVGGATHPVFEIVIGVVLVICVITVHGIGVRIVSRRFSRAWSQVTVATPHWRINLILMATVGALASLHMIEGLLIAVPLFLSGLFPTLRDSYYFALESYTTLGASTLALPDAWRLLGPLIATAGIFTYGWTGGVLVDIMSRYGKLDTQQARIDAAQERDERPPAAQRDAGAAPGAASAPQ
jgi:hypothetical protein